jgi:hypothetical protein
MATAQNPNSGKNVEAITDSSDSPLAVFDGPGDTTIRPAPSNLPRYFPGREPPPGYSGEKRPPDSPPHTAS